MAQSVAIRARLPQPAGMSITPSQWRVLTDAIFPSAKTPEAIVLAMDYCAARKLDPFKKAVHIVPMWNSSLGREVETVWPGINELQVTATRTGQWAGMDEPKWGPLIKRIFKGRVGKKGYERDVEVAMEYPEWCAVTVYRMLGGTRHPFTEPVYWIEAYSRQGRTEVPNEMWQKRTRGQVHKVAKAASLRAAFPEEMGNDYTSDEMEGKEIESGGIVIDGHAEPSSHADPIAAKMMDQYDAGMAREEGNDRELSWVEQLDEKLGNEPNGTKWLKLLDAECVHVPELEDAEAIAGLATVRAAYEKAPELIQGRINEIIRKAVAKFDVAIEPEPDFISAETEDV